ncbi:hypothetical protein [Dendrosporobacter sp. 1207_IL3150]|uniref:hypothetical protein n=1 Tax=Dendrosporobacter sp. 1207_IL3150 TaxID=3084054 RepID=UPI002FDB0AD6
MNKENMKIEELSNCLDDLNQGKHPNIKSADVKELIDVAAVVKKSYTDEDVPTKLIGEMADKLAFELGGRKPKRKKHWLYGSFAAAVAAGFVVAFVHVLPPQPADDISPQISIADESKVSDQPSQEYAKTIDSSSSKSQSEVVENKVSKTPQLIEKAVISEPIVEDRTNYVAMRKQQDSSETENENILMARIASDLPLETKSEDAENKSIIMMVIPNQEAYSVTIDKNNGIIRQLYNQGTKDEIIITQTTRELDQDMKKTKEQATIEKSVSDIVVLNDPDRKAIIVKREKYVLKIEGVRPIEELQQIAGSLIEKKVENK